MLVICFEDRFLLLGGTKEQQRLMGTVLVEFRLRVIPIYVELAFLIKNEIFKDFFRSLTFQPIQLACILPFLFLLLADGRRNNCFLS